MGIKRSIILFLSTFLAFCTQAEIESTQQKEPLPTHAEAALFLVKYSGLFKRYVPQEASLSTCVSFLNRKGVFFGLKEVVNGEDFTLKDCARVLGQIELMLSGEAKYLSGKIVLPKGMASWEEFCVMNGVQYVEAFHTIIGILQQIRMAVEQFPSYP